MTTEAHRSLYDKIVAPLHTRTEFNREPGARLIAEHDAEKDARLAQALDCQDPEARKLLNAIYESGVDGGEATGSALDLFNEYKQGDFGRAKLRAQIAELKAQIGAEVAKGADWMSEARSLKSRTETAEALVVSLRNALIGVVRVADRQTREFDAARSAIVLTSAPMTSELERLRVSRGVDIRHILNRMETVTGTSEGGVLRMAKQLEVANAEALNLRKRCDRFIEQADALRAKVAELVTAGQPLRDVTATLLPYRHRQIAAWDAAKQGLQVPVETAEEKLLRRLREVRAEVGSLAAFFRAIGGLPTNEPESWPGLYKSVEKERDALRKQLAEITRSTAPGELS